MRYFLLLSAFTISTTCVAQITLPVDSSQVNLHQADRAPRSYETMHFYAGGMVAIPAADFRKSIHNSIGNLGAGVQGGILFNLVKGTGPALLGIDFGYFNYGQNKTAGTAYAPPMKTTFNVFSWNAVMRFRTASSLARFTPFLDPMVGVKIYNTLTKIDKNATNIILNTNQREVINKVTHAGINYGIGAGFVSYGKTGDAGFYFRAAYWWGPQIEYVVRDSMVVDSNGNVSYQTARANTSNNGGACGALSLICQRTLIND